MSHFDVVYTYLFHIEEEVYGTVIRIWFSTLRCVNPLGCFHPILLRFESSRQHSSPLRFITDPIPSLL